VRNVTYRRAKAFRSAFVAMVLHPCVPSRTEGARSASLKKNRAGHAQKSSMVRRNLCTLSRVNNAMSTSLRAALGHTS
jgi:hypothetical protein